MAEDNSAINPDFARENPNWRNTGQPSPVRASAQETTGSLWIVLVGEGSFRKCYGMFDSYDAAVNWLRENQFTPAECGIYPVNGYDVRDVSTNFGFGKK